MKIVVEAYDKKFRRLAQIIKKTATKLARFFDLRKRSLEIYLVGNDFMKKNVLAFPAPKNFPHPDTAYQPLGEIYLNPDYIKKESSYLKIPAKLDYMLVHGFLHLLGYDHKKKGDTIRMQKKEASLLKKIYAKLYSRS